MKLSADIIWLVPLGVEVWVDIWCCRKGPRHLGNSPGYLADILPNGKVEVAHFSFNADSAPTNRRTFWIEDVELANVDDESGWCVVDLTKERG